MCVFYLLLFFRYLYYFENGNPIIHVRYISGLIMLINEQNATGDAGAPALSSAVEAHYRNTLGKTCTLLHSFFELFCFYVRGVALFFVAV